MNTRLRLGGPVIELKNSDGSRTLRFGRTDLHDRVGVEVDGQVLFTIDDEVKDRLGEVLKGL